MIDNPFHPESPEGRAFDKSRMDATGAMMAAGAVMSAREALETIFTMMDGTEWDADTLQGIALVLGSAGMTPRNSSDSERTAPACGLEVRHDMLGYYVCTDQEAEHEDEGNASVGFDGRPHYAELDWAIRAARAEEGFRLLGEAPVF